MMQTLKNTMMVVVESLINKFEEDQLKKEEMHRRSHCEQLDGHYMDNCSDNDSSFSQVCSEKTVCTSTVQLLIHYGSSFD